MRDDVRECRFCPPQVAKCVHFDGRAVTFARRDLLPADHAYHDETYNFSVALDSVGGLQDCTCGCDGQGAIPVDPELFYLGDDEALAEAAFDKALVVLMAGDL